MNKSIQIRKTVLAAVFAAVILAATGYLPRLAIPGGYIHFGDAFIYIAACFLPLPYAAASAAVGAALADTLTGYAVWAPGTLVIKALMTLAFCRRGYKMFTVRNLLASALACVICTGGYYIYEALIVSNFTVALESIPFNLIQGVGSAAIFAAASFALDRADVKRIAATRSFYEP